MQPIELKDAMCKILDDNKAVDITVLKVEHLTVLADYFIICTGRSSKQVRALAEHVEETLKADEITPLRSDGMRDGKWAVLDYGSVILHVFNDDTRMFYCLEKLWSDGENIEFYKGDK